jgi:hypothetical protein
MATYFVTVSTQDNCMRDYLSLWGAPLRERIRIVHYENLLAQADFAPGTYILAATDQMDEESIGHLARVHAALEDRPGFRFVNHPTRTLQRLDLLTALQESGLNDFRVAPVTGDLDSLRFPVFLRGNTSHDGALTPLLRSRREIDGGIAMLTRRGRRLDDLLAVEFCDTADESGIYRKYAAFLVGDRVIPRSLMHGRGWMLKQAETEFTVERSLEELEYVRTNPHEEQLSRIARVAGVEYGRIDYAVRDGRVQTWEINLKPTIGRGALRQRSGRVPPEVEPIRDATKERFYTLFQAALEALEVPATEEIGAVPVRVQPPRPPLAPIGTLPRTRLPGLRRRLRPFRRFLRPAIDFVEGARDRVLIQLLSRPEKRARG